MRERIQNLLQHLYEGLYEREKSIRLALLASVAGESIFLLGPPGVGKSLIARRLKYAFKDGNSFEYLMSKFSTPDEIFGPISIKKLKEDDKYERLTENYMPNANIVFLDEIWKAGPAIQNALLTILNEKIYRNGDKDIPVDILGIISASNEIPNQRTELAAIWDRFLIRLEIHAIKKYKNLLQMITNTEDLYQDGLPETLKISPQEIQNWSAQINAIEVPAEVLNTIQVVKHKLDTHNAQANNEPILVFDRRWKKIVRLLRTSAFLNGRDKVDLMDCFLMVDCLWTRPEQLERIREIVSETIRKHGYSMSVNLNMLKREIEEFEQDVREETQVRYAMSEEVLFPIDEQYYEILNDGTQFKGKLIQIKDFKTFTVDDYQITNVYDAERNLLNRVRIKRSEGEFSIDIYFNSQKQVFKLKTIQHERQETVYKKPHKIVEAYWDERFQKLQKYIQTQQTRIQKEAPQEFNTLHQNLFVDAELGDIVRSNMDEVREALQQLRLRLEKVHHTYTELLNN